MDKEYMIQHGHSIYADTSFKNEKQLIKWYEVSTVKEACKRALDNENIIYYIGNYEFKRLN